MAFSLPLGILSSIFLKNKTMPKNDLREKFEAWAKKMGLPYKRSDPAATLTWAAWQEGYRSMLAKTPDQYPPLPEDCIKDAFGCLYTPAQMRSYVDADRAARG